MGVYVVVPVVVGVEVEVAAVVVVVDVSVVGVYVVVDAAVAAVVVGAAVVLEVAEKVPNWMLLSGTGDPDWLPMEGYMFPLTGMEADVEMRREGVLP